MDTVIVINEECHGMIGIAQDYKSVVTFLVNEYWLPCYVCDNHEEWKFIPDVLGEYWVDKILSWDIDNFNEFFEGAFHLREENIINFSENS